MLSTDLFVRPGFRLLFTRLAVHYLGAYSVLRSLINQANFTGDGNEYSSCVSVRYNSLFISLVVVYKFRQKVARQREMAKSCMFERT